MRVATLGRLVSAVLFGRGLFVFLKRWHRDLRALPVRDMDGFGIMTKRLLSVAEWISRFASAFRPGIPVRMQGYAGDVESLAALAEFIGPVLGFDLAQIRKEGPGLWQ